MLFAHIVCGSEPSSALRFSPVKGESGRGRFGARGDSAPGYPPPSLASHQCKFVTSV